MKLRITLKDPDGVSESVSEAVRESLAKLEVSDAEREVLSETRRENLAEQIRKFVEYGEYVTIEIDTDEQTATVIPYK